MNLLFTAQEASILGIGPVALIIGLILVGLILGAAEVFITPGFGVAGITGLVLLFAGSVTAWILLGPKIGALTIIVSVVGIVALAIGFAKSRAVRRRFVLDASLGHGKGTESEDLSRFVGVQGVTKTDLRPAGIAFVDGTRLDVVSDGDFIDKDVKIKIVAVDGPRVVAAKMDE